MTKKEILAPPPFPGNPNINWSVVKSFLTTVSLYWVPYKINVLLSILLQILDLMKLSYDLNRLPLRLSVTGIINHSHTLTPFTKHSAPRSNEIHQSDSKPEKPDIVFLIEVLD